MPAKIPALVPYGVEPLRLTGSPLRRVWIRYAVVHPAVTLDFPTVSTPTPVPRTAAILTMLAPWVYRRAGSRTATSPPGAGLAPRACACSAVVAVPTAGTCPAVASTVVTGALVAVTVRPSPRSAAAGCALAPATPGSAPLLPPAEPGSACCSRSCALEWFTYDRLGAASRSSSLPVQLHKCPPLRPLFPTRPRPAPGSLLEQMSASPPNQSAQCRCPGAGGVSGPPAKHCATAIHRVAVSPTTVSAVSAILRPWVTT